MKSALDRGSRVLTRARIVEGDRVVDRVPDNPRDVVVDRSDQLDASRRVIERGLGEGVRDDHAGRIDTQMELLPAPATTTSMYRRSPFTLADDRQTTTVDDEVKARALWHAPSRAIEVPATAGHGRVIGRPQIEPHQYEERPENTLNLTERQMEEKTPRQGRFNREVRVLPLRAPCARSVRFPGGDSRRRSPDGDVASANQSSIIGRPVLDAVFRLIFWMNPRLHSFSLVCYLETSYRIRAPTPRNGTNVMNLSSLLLGVRRSGKLTGRHAGRLTCGAPRPAWLTRTARRSGGAWRDANGGETVPRQRATALRSSRAPFHHGQQLPRKDTVFQELRKTAPFPPFQSKQPLLRYGGQDIRVVVPDTVHPGADGAPLV